MTFYMNAVADDNRRYHDGSTRVDNTTCAESGTMIIIIILYLLLMLPERKKLLIANTYLDIKYNCFVELPKIVQVTYIGCTNSRMLERNY